MPKKPHAKKPKPRPETQPEPTTEIAEVPQEDPVETTSAVEELATEVIEETVAPVSTDQLPIDSTQRNDSFDEILIGHGEDKEYDDEPLPDVMVLMGNARERSVEEQGEGYHTQSIMGNAENNLIWYPAIVSGRCELCGSRRYVGGEVWKQIERKTGEVKYKYRKGKWEELSACNCKHYRHINIECSFCNEQFTGEKDKIGQFTQLLSERTVWVTADHATPKKLVMVCSDFNCKNKFDEMFNINNKI